MEHDVVWGYVSILLSIGLGIYLFMNHEMLLYGYVAIIVMIIATVFIAQLYISLVNDISKKTLNDAMKAGLTEIGENTNGVK